MAENVLCALISLSCHQNMLHRGKIHFVCMQKSFFMWIFSTLVDRWNLCQCVSKICNFIIGYIFGTAMIQIKIVFKRIADVLFPRIKSVVWVISKVCLICHMRWIWGMLLVQILHDAEHKISWEIWLKCLSETSLFPWAWAVSCNWAIGCAF